MANFVQRVKYVARIVAFVEICKTAGAIECAKQVLNDYDELDSVSYHKGPFTITLNNQKKKSKRKEAKENDA